MYIYMYVYAYTHIYIYVCVHIDLSLHMYCCVGVFFDVPGSIRRRSMWESVNI